MNSNKCSRELAVEHIVAGQVDLEDSECLLTEQNCFIVFKLALPMLYALELNTTTHEVAPREKT